MENASKTNAAQAVLGWLNSHPRQLEIAKRYAVAGPQYLGNWVRQVIYPPSFLPLHPDDARKLIALRDSFTREEFDRIDWPSVWSKLTQEAGRAETAESGKAGTEWTVRSRYETTDGDRVTLLYLYGSEVDRFAVSYSYTWPHAPQFIEYADRVDAVTAFVRSLNSAERRGVVAHKEG
ncbi:hypothetical protein [Streptomyces sp. NPDC001843]|uniref:hypothetical protein n=1 Tax=Streptomyces sp. NPDC001843 TaxID=3364617 RepID=UPI0036804EFA